MKIQVRIFLILLFSAMSATVTYSQSGKIITPTEAEIKKMQLKKIAEDPSAKLNATQKTSLKEKAQAYAVYLTKAILHKSDPTNYPWTDKMNPMETRALNVLDRISPALLRKANTNIQRIMADPGKMEITYGKYKTIDFKAGSVGTIMKDLGLQITTVDNTLKVMKAEDNKIQFYVDKLWCMDETSPENGDDDMVIGGILVGASGKVKVANTVVSCRFNDNDICNHGEFHFGSVGLTTTNNYPKTYCCVFVLVESDKEPSETASDLTAALQVVVSSWESANDDPEEVAAEIKYAIESFVPLFVYDDLFPAYITSIKLNGSNSFGADNRSDDNQTNNITAHGGTYRLQYFLKKLN
jgi:hypothetical protein